TKPHAQRNWRSVRDRDAFTLAISKLHVAIDYVCGIRLFVFERVIDVLTFLKHFVVDETDATERFGKQLFLFLCWVQTEFVGFVGHIHITRP
ncbi:hypothetical protein CathTA2_0051, partial [Caldalkalibacillus thermarum TA2.A1]